MFNASVVGANKIAAEFAVMGVTLGAKEAGIVAHYGAVYQTRVRGRMSGRPGLRAVTGDARRRVQLEIRRTQSGTQAEVFTDWVAARRHEFGWNGIDSIGRHIPTPPRPAWEPDFERTANEMYGALAAVAVPA